MEHRPLRRADAAQASPARRRARRDRGSASRCRASSRVRCALRTLGAGPADRRSSVRKKSRPVSPIARTRGSAASSSITAIAASSSPAASYAGASFGWIATAARTRGLGCRGPRRPATGLDVSPGLHDADHADRGRAVELLRECQRLVAVDDLEVGVVVVHRDGQRLGRRRPPHIPRAVVVPLPHVPARIRHALCSTRGNSGASALTVAPAGSLPHPPASRIGWSVQRAERLAGTERDPQLAGRDAA